MRVLFYGGCHAGVFRHIFDQYTDDVDIDHITNYKIISARKPFPYEKLSEFDWIVYSAIKNKGEWNTEYLIENCKIRGVKFISYPWLQWEGYHPKVKKRTGPGWFIGWWSYGLDELAKKFSEFDRFRQEVLYGDAFVDDVWQNLEAAFIFSRDSEAETDIKFVDYIERNFRRSRLFPTPDHAATPVYQHVVRQMIDAMGCRFDESFFLSSTELQDGVSVPILPSVSRALKLDFHAPDFQHKLILGKNVLNLTKYLQIHYQSDRLMFLQSTTQTTVLRENREQSPIAVPNGTRLLCTLEQASQGTNRVSVIATTSGPTSLAIDGRTVILEPAHWTRLSDPNSA